MQYSGGHPSDELISAFLVGAIDDPAIGATVSGHLETCPACREQVAQLQAITKLLAELPAPPLPRSFTLTREELDRLQPRPWYLRYQPVCRWASAIAAALLVVLLGLDLLVFGPTAVEIPGAAGVRQATPEPIAEAPAAAMNAPQERTAAAEPTAAPALASTPVGKEVPTDESMSIMATTPEADQAAAAPNAAPATGGASTTVSTVLRLGASLAGIVFVISVGVGFVVPRLVARRGSHVR